MNSRFAQVCSQCGSRELSTPAPHLPFWMKPFLLLLSILPGFVLLLLSFVFIAVFIRQLLSDPNALLKLMSVGLVLGLCWYIWINLPGLFRKTVLKVIKKGGKHDTSKH